MSYLDSNLKTYILAKPGLETDTEALDCLKERNLVAGFEICNRSIEEVKSYSNKEFSILLHHLFWRYSDLLSNPKMYGRNDPSAGDNLEQKFLEYVEISNPESVGFHVAGLLYHQPEEFYIHKDEKSVIRTVVQNLEYVHRLLNKNGKATPILFESAVYRPGNLLIGDGDALQLMKEQQKISNLSTNPDFIKKIIEETSNLNSIRYVLDIPHLIESMKMIEQFKDRDKAFEHYDSTMEVVADITSEIHICNPIIVEGSNGHYHSPFHRDNDSTIKTMKFIKRVIGDLNEGVLEHVVFEYNIDHQLNSNHTNIIAELNPLGYTKFMHKQIILFHEMMEAI